MEITREEQQLLALFRRLAPAKRQALLDLAGGLTTQDAAAAGEQASGQCPVGHKTGQPFGDNTVVTE